MAKHTLIAYVEDVPGVLNRVASLFRRRNFNIDSLTVGGTDQPGVSRLTVVVETTEAGARIVEANLYKLVNVLRVDDLTHKASLTRELGLVKVKVTPDTRVEVNIFVNGVTFEDGTIQQVFTAADFDSLGRVYVKFLYPAGLRTSICHRIHVYEGDVLVGTF